MPILTHFLKTTPGKVTAGGGLLGLCALGLACSVFGTLLPDRDEAAPAEIAAPAATIQVVEPAPLAELPTPAAPTASPLPPPTHTPLPPAPTASPTETPLPPPPAATEALAPAPATLPDLPLQQAQVSHIVDGDTIDVRIEGVEYRVRYILMDTPETHGGTEPFGPEASAANAALVAGQTVWLEKDVSETDRYGQSFFVRQAYFTGADEPYDKLERALKADINREAWETLYRTESVPFDKPATGQIAVKVINHYGDEVLKVYGVG